jgi:hypothetical protein
MSADLMHKLLVLNVPRRMMSVHDWKAVLQVRYASYSIKRPQILNKVKTSRVDSVVSYLWQWSRLPITDTQG